LGVPFPSDVARTSDLEALRLELRGEMADLRGKLKADLGSEVAALRNQLFAANVARRPSPVWFWSPPH
jgi:hypothetical protein